MSRSFFRENAMGVGRLSFRAAKAAATKAPNPPAPFPTRSSLAREGGDPASPFPSPAAWEREQGARSLPSPAAWERGRG